MTNPLITGYYAFQTHGDGLCCYVTKLAAVHNAAKAAARESSSVTVYSPAGVVVYIATRRTAAFHAIA